MMLNINASSKVERSRRRRLSRLAHEKENREILWRERREIFAGLSSIRRGNEAAGFRVPKILGGNRAN